MSVIQIQRHKFGTGAKDLAALALGTSTTETAFSTNGSKAGSVTVVSSVVDVISIPGQGQQTMYWDNGKPFGIYGWGTLVTGVSTNLTLKVYQVPASILAAATQGTLANDNVVAASSARAVNSTTGMFSFDLKLQWNSTTKLLHGTSTFTIANNLDAVAAVTAVTTATAFDTELNFLVSATLSSGNAANVVTLRGIEVYEVE
jgi:hypothetical protein